MLLRNQEQMALNRVETLCVEAAGHYESVAGKTSDAVLSGLFSRLAARRHVLAEELAMHIRSLDDLPQYPDPDSEAIKNILTSIKTLFSTDESNTLIDERVNSENEIASATREAQSMTQRDDTKAMLGRILSDVEDAIAQLTAARH